MSEKNIARTIRAARAIAVTGIVATVIKPMAEAALCCCEAFLADRIEKSERRKIDYTKHYNGFK